MSKLEKLRLEYEDLEDEIKLTHDPAERRKLEIELDELESRIFELEISLPEEEDEQND